MLTTNQIILRLLLCLVFGLIIFLFQRKKEKIIEPEIYPLFSLFCASLAIFSLKIFFHYYSKIDLTILPAVLTLGIFLIGKNIIQKNGSKSAMITIIFLFLTAIVGLALGFGFYNLAIFLTILIIVWIADLPSKFRQLWQKLKKQSGQN